MAQEPDFKTAVENLYRTFRRYNTGLAPEGCPCCVDKDDRQKLISKPLEKLTWVELSHFAFKAISTWGDADSFRRFLPRIFEILDQNPPWDIPLILGKLRLANWSHWPESERTVINDFFLAAWFRHLNEAEACPEDDDWLRGFVRAEAEMQPLLDCWIECRCARGYAKLAAFAKNPFDGAYWNEGHEEQAELERWLSSVVTGFKLEHIFDENVDAFFSSALANAVDAINQHRKAHPLNFLDHLKTMPNAATTKTSPGKGTLAEK